MKPKCYSCKWRSGIPGDAHSCCINPKSREELGIKGNEIGIRRGWFSWPRNFDPIWLQNCSGFEPEEGDES